MEWLHDINFFSVTLRLVLAVLFGGIIGLERGANKHQAGLRTHILVCVGATLAMLTNAFIFEEVTTFSDPARLGAQVISGIGFLGAGLILVTSRNKVKGLTTAAGLWASACIGLALGIGFYEGALIAGILVFIVLAFLPRLEAYVYDRSRLMNVFVELDSMNNLRRFINNARSQDFIIVETQVSKSDNIVDHGYNLNLSFRIPKQISHDDVLRSLSKCDGVFLVEELE